MQPSLGLRDELLPGFILCTAVQLQVLALGLGPSHENMVYRRRAARTFKGVGIVIGPNRGKCVLAAEFTKLPSILRFRGVSMKFRVEISSNHKNIPDWKMCEDSVQRGPNLSSTFKWFGSCGGDFSRILIDLD